MLGYVCKYTPVELLTAMGAEPVRLLPSVTEFNTADTLMHPNVCSYVKAVLEDFAARPDDYEGIVFTTCCDSVRRLFDTLKKQYPEKFFYLLDLPRKVNDFAIGLYEKRVWQMAESYAAFRGKPMDADARAKLEAALTEITARQKNEMRQSTGTAANAKLRVGILGARSPQNLVNLVENCGGTVVFNLSCTGGERADDLWRKGKDIPYAQALLDQIPCMRMVDATNRREYLKGFEDSIDGVIYHTVKFCDAWSYEYAELNGENRRRADQETNGNRAAGAGGKGNAATASGGSAGEEKNERPIPLLKLETDLTAQCEGQIRTRVEAFMEELRKRKTEDTDLCEIRNRRETAMQDTLVMGIDSGSTSTNAVLMNGEKKILAETVIRTGAKTSSSAEKALETVLADAGKKRGRTLVREDLSYIVSTGYGRVSIPFADANITEISCHARGAVFLDPGVRTILDIGGQDSKAIRLDDSGEVADFVMNDKCAAGTGRFLEAMARTLEVPIEELGPVSLKAKEKVEISSMCTVFAESEVISLIAQNKEKADIARGVHEAIAGKAVSLMKRVGLHPDYMMTGGVARNPGVVKAVSERIGAPLKVPENPDLVGAIGAALFALERSGAV